MARMSIQTSLARLSLLIPLWIPSSAQCQTPPTATVVGHDEFVVVPAPSEGTRWGSQILAGRAGCSSPPHTPMTHQWVFDAPQETPSPIRSIAMRRATVPAGPNLTVPSFSLTAELWMAHAAARPTAISFRYTANRGPDYRRVMTARTLSFAAVPWRADGDYPFTYRFPFDNPFALSAGSVGLVELALSNSTLCGNLSHVEFYLPNYPSGYLSARAMSVGQGCAPTGSLSAATIAALVHPLAIGQGGAWILWVPANESQQAQSMMMVGTNNTHWSGSMLPFDLTALGAPGCTLYAGIDWTVPMLSSSSVFKTAVITAPLDPQLIGAHVYVQGLRLRQSFNALGAITTNALRFQIIDGVDSRMWTSAWSADHSFGLGVREEGGPGGPVLLLNGR